MLIWMHRCKANTWGVTPNMFSDHLDDRNMIIESIINFDHFWLSTPVNDNQMLELGFELGLQKGKWS
jgi:multimeric flavodoxin WrbA